MPTFREADGLAMSSRNLRLSVAEREKAPEIFRQLESIKLSLNRGVLDFSQLENKACNNLIATGFVPEYVSICEVDTLLPAKELASPKVILVAAKLGEIRLIDNLQV